MAKQRNLVADYLVYVVVRFFACVIQALPYAAALSLARGLAWLAYKVDRRHRLVAEENLRHAFPGRYADAELTEVVKKVYRHLCTLMIEITCLHRKMYLTNWRRLQDVRNGRLLVDTMLQGRPLVMITGHFGNWELSSYALGLLGFNIQGVARDLDNPYLDRYLRGFRQQTGQVILSKNKDWPQMQAVLARGGRLGMLADQDAGQKGQFVDFFGRPASTFKAIAILSLEYNAPILVSMTVKVGEPLRYENVTADVIDPQEYQGRHDAVAAITQRYSAALERVIRENPEQYFWLHRRWKHQPLKKGKKVA